MGELLVGVVDDAVDVGAAFLSVVDAEVDLADADIERNDLARLAGVHRQRVGIIRLANGAGLGSDDVNRHGAGAIGEQAGEVADSLRVGQDVGVEDLLRDHQHEAAVAGDDVGDDTVAGEQRHDAEDVAGFELGDHGTGAGVVGHRDLGVAGDDDADGVAFVAGFEDGLVAFVGRQSRLDDDFLDLVGREVLEQLDLFKEKTLQIDFAHAVSPP